MNKPKIKMRIVDSCYFDAKESFYSSYLIKTLSKKYDIEYSDNPDYLIIYGPLYRKAEYFNYDCTRIFYTYENIRANLNVVDYAITFDYMEFEDRHLRMPYFASRHPINFTKRHEFLTRKTKFCGTVISHSGPTTALREQFFNEIYKYKQIDSGGRWNNNIGGPVANKIEWLKDYKFNICFENSSYPGYLTEKLFDAFASGCIPIYWGDTSLRIPHKDEYKKYFMQNNKSYVNNKHIAMHSSLNHAPNIAGGGG